MVEITVGDRVFHYRRFDRSSDGCEMTESELLKHLGEPEDHAVSPGDKLVIYAGNFIRVQGKPHELSALFTILEAKPGVKHVWLYRDDLLYWEYDAGQEATFHYLRDAQKITIRCHRTGNGYHIPWSPLPQRPKALPDHKVDCCL